jgi:hypothetical protein
MSYQRKIISADFRFSRRPQECICEVYEAVNIAGDLKDKFQWGESEKRMSPTKYETARENAGKPT